MRPVVGVCSLLLIGCAESVLPPVPVFTLASTNLMAGGPVEVRSTEFRTRGDGASLQLGAVSLPLSRLNDTAFGASLPQTLSGPFTPTLLLGAEQRVLAPVSVAGTVAYFIYPSGIGSNTVLHYRDGHPVAFGGIGGGKLGVYDLERNELTSSPIFDDAQLHGPVPTPEDGVFLLRSAGGASSTLDKYQMNGAVPTKVGSYGNFLSGSFLRGMIQLNSNTFVTASNHLFQVLRRSDDGSVEQILFGQAEETEGVYLSPRKDRATLQVDYMPQTGIPVFEATTGQVAYWVTQLVASRGAAFTGDGAELAMVGSKTGGVFGPGRILRLNSTTGAVLGDTTIDRSVFAVAYDTERPWLYVGVETPGDIPAVLVLDRATSRVLGQMRATEASTGVTCCYQGIIAPSPSTNSVYAFYYKYAWKFSLPSKGP